MADEYEPAFPMSALDGYEQRGMTLRDWFAGQALAGLVSGRRGPPNMFAKEAFLVADVMMAERKATGQ